MDQDKRPDPTKKSPANKPESDPVHTSDVEDFFNRLKNDMRRPKPGQEDISAALQAMQRLAFHVDHEEAVNGAALEGAEEHEFACVLSRRAECGRQQVLWNCGAPVPEAPLHEPGNPVTDTGVPPPSPTVSGQHHYHHHYHHHYFPAGSVAAEGQPVAGGPRASGGGSDAARPRAGAAGSLSRAESAVRKLTQDWALACNNRQLEDLMEFYSADALVLRSNVPPVRGTAAIREFFYTALDSGLAEVEMDPIRVEMFGDLAYEAGRCKMLVPVAVGKRREERGKYLVIFAKQAGGDWKAIADCWASDLSLGVSAEPDTTKPGSIVANGLPAKSPRKSA